MRIMLNRVIKFQKMVLSSSPSILAGMLPFLSFCLFATINIPVGFAAGITMALYQYYHANDSAFQKEKEKFGVLNLYLSGYIIFFIVILVIWSLFLLIGLPIHFFTTGNLDGVFAEMTTVSMKDVIEMMFSICLYQFSVFYMLRMNVKNMLIKKNISTLFFFAIGFIFIFTSSWIVEQLILQYLLLLLLLIGVFILPLLSIRDTQILR